jgi:hypothetical protein
MKTLTLPLVLTYIGCISAGCIGGYLIGAQHTTAPIPPAPMAVAAPSHVMHLIPYNGPYDPLPVTLSPGDPGTIEALAADIRARNERAAAQMQREQDHQEEMQAIDELRQKQDRINGY